MVDDLYKVSINVIDWVIGIFDEVVKLKVLVRVFDDFVKIMGLFLMLLLVIGVLVEIINNVNV